MKQQIGMVSLFGPEKLRPIVRYGLLIAVTVCFAGTCRAETLLRWKFKPGEKLRYEIQQASDTRTTVTGKPTTAAIKMGMELTWQVEKVDEQGRATISQTIDRLSATLKVDNLEPIVYDSTSRSPPSGAAKDLAEAGKVLVGAPCTVELNTRGEITSFEPSDTLRESLAKIKPGNLFSTDGLSRIVQQASFVVPEKPVAEGATWEVSNETPSPLGVLEQVNRYTYVGPAEKDGTMLERIDLETKLALQPMKSRRATPVELKESEQRGTLWFDNSAGRLSASTLTQRLVTERPYREMRIRVQTTTTMEMKLIP